MKSHEVPAINTLFSGAVYVSVKTVAKAVDVSIATVWRMAADGRLPKPHKLSSGMTRWRADEVRAALDKLAA